ncbi:hypothetical protein [Caloramator sp. Dgby_cultured_2]|uniref:hypothetical protein n=1 Tax=Caloramator sp. Dgby_cultured_2 TaxID=3029174 RepID=UPI00237E107D|nr:hypothetical protein [Caloramator sp. Dgby_cultured_2]WDU82707.1 hypothetical protein PWK10_14330 [Caloramator sp. Dgby_cultured_2]
MQVAGITNQQEVFVVSKDKPFKINQILIIEDKLQGTLRGEVVETTSYNKFVPLNINGEMADGNILASLKNLGYEIDENTIYIAKVRLIQEAMYPVTTGSKVRFPKFNEVKDLLVKGKDRGLVLGVIKSTEELLDTIDEDLEDLLHFGEWENYKSKWRPLYIRYKIHESVSPYRDIWRFRLRKELWNEGYFRGDYEA